MNWRSIDLINWKKRLRNQKSNHDLFSIGLGARICLKELLESFDFTDRIKKMIKVRNQYQYKSRKILEIGCGHGFISYILLFKKLASLAYQIDLHETKAHKKLTRDGNAHTKMIFFKGNCYDEKAFLLSLDYDIIIGCHLCGNLTDFAIDLAIEKGCDLAIMPCCYGKKKSRGNEKRIREIFGTEALDIYRCTKLLNKGYNIRCKYINPAISPMNRIIIGKRGEFF